MQTFFAFVQLIRPKQWTKNLVVFAGLMFTGNLFRLPLLLKTGVAFVLFCLAAGAVYILNDLRDRESDRKHPEKRHRPLAANRITAEAAGLGAGLLLTASLAGAMLFSKSFAILLLAYLVLNLAYTLGVKHWVILDVLTVAAGFVVRAAAGAVAIEAEISPWLLIVTTLLSLFLGFAKRRHELLILGEKAASHRPSLNEYSPQLLDQYMVVVASSTIIAYSLYAFTSATARQHHDYLMLTVPFVIYGILRYLYLVYQKNLGGAPELILLQDKPLILDILLWVAAVGWIVTRG